MYKKPYYIEARDENNSDHYTSKWRCSDTNKYEINNGTPNKSQMANPPLMYTTPSAPSYNIPCMKFHISVHLEYRKHIYK